LIRLLAGEREHESAIEKIDELPKTLPDNWTFYLEAAERVAQCVLDVKVDLNLSPERRAALVDSYGRHAVELLHLAIEKGLPDPEHLQRRSELFLLYSRPDFQALTERKPTRAE
jgi:hypothetical protein